MKMQANNLEEAFQQICAMEAPLDERMAAFDLVQLGGDREHRPDRIRAAGESDELDRDHVLAEGRLAVERLLDRLQGDLARLNEIAIRFGNASRRQLEGEERFERRLLKTKRRELWARDERDASPVV